MILGMMIRGAGRSGRYNAAGMAVRQAHANDMRAQLDANRGQLSFGGMVAVIVSLAVAAAIVGGIMVALVYAGSHNYTPGVTIPPPPVATYYQGPF